MSLNKNLLDDTSWAILEALQENGRIPYSELGKKVGLSTPAVSERVRKLEENGIITGYRATLDMHKLGREITAFVSIRSTPDKNKKLIEFIKNSPVVEEGHYITGQASYIVKIVVPKIKDMETFIGEISHFGATNTSVVMSTHVDKKIFRDL
ncbi:MAG: Lrp/AsnC family transcriptional regulator [Chloroflexota bacterium]